MAKCEKREIAPVPPVEYVLTLSTEEARHLRIITSGKPGLGASTEAVALAVWNALVDAGAEYRP